MMGCAQDRPVPDVSSPVISVLRQTIINGKPDSRYPAVGALAWLGGSFCTGTLIAPRIVLTAAHCIDAAQGFTFANMDAIWLDLSFRIEVPSSTAPEGYEFRYFTWVPEKAIVHPQWNSSNEPYQFDIGVIVLSKPVPSDVATPIPFRATTLDPTMIGKNALLMGYGQIQTLPFFRSVENKYSGTVPIVKLSSTYLTYGSKESSRSCYGDSGGPILFESNGSMSVLSVNSHGTEGRGSLPGFPGTFICDGASNSVRTDIYADFINKWLALYGYGSNLCRKNSDCGFCGECSDQGRCQPKSIPTLKTTCRPCSKDADCDSGVCSLGPNGFRCFQQCAFEQCCQSGSQCSPISLGSTTKYCKPIDSCPDVSCQSDADCGKLGSCQKGVCRLRKTKRQPQLCRSCLKSSDCGAQSVCYGVTTDGRCLQPCEEGALCPDGFTCRSVYEGMPKQCVPKQRWCLLSCASDKDCSQGESCLKGYCYEDAPAKEGELCLHGKCEAPLQCVYSRFGYVCMKGCGPARGLPGSPCMEQQTCSGGATCFGSTDVGRKHVCLHTCKTNDDCKKNGSSLCFQGYCMCSSDKDCDANYQCNKSTGMVGACAPKQEPATCGAQQQCLSPYRFASFCATTSAGLQALGEPCDALNRCIEGLSCLRVRGGSLCLQSCARNNDCTLGGKCWGVNSQQSACVCSKGGCAEGRRCVAVISTLRGVCKSEGKQECLSPRDCPKGFQCVEKKCFLPGSEEPSPEKTEEANGSEPTSPTEVVQDAGAQDSPQEAAPEAKDSATSDQLQAPGSGCGCSSPMGTPFSLLWWVGLLGLALITRRFLGMKG